MEDLKEKAIGGGLAGIVAQLAMFILRFGTLMVLARLLTPEDFGLVAMVAAFAGALNLFRDFGLSAATVQRQTVTPELISTLFWINLAVGIALALLLLALSSLIASFYQEARLQAITAALAAGFLFSAAGVQHRVILERSMRFATLALIEVLSLVAASMLSILMAWNGHGYWSLVAMTIAVPLVSTACIWKVTGWIPGRPSKQAEVRSVVQFGGTMTLNLIVVYIAYNLEKVLLGRFWGAEALGIYGRAYQLVSIPTDNLNSAIGGVVFSALSRIQDDPGRLRNYFLKGYSLLLSLTIPISIALALFADDIILVVLGEKWNNAAPVLRALAPTVLVLAIINPLGWLLYSLGFVGRSLRIALVLAPIVIAGYLVGLPYGPMGVAGGYSVAMLLWVVPHILWCVHGTPISFTDILRATGKPLVSGAIAGLLAAGMLALDIAAPPLVRLFLSCTVLFGAHFAIMMFVMGEKDVYFDLVRGLLRPRTTV